MNSLKLSIVDQSPVHDGKTQAEALQDTVKLAKMADQLGYKRYWVAEHHATASYASPCPEIVIGQIAAATENIKVGSGGVMLTHYSPYKVAEVFRTLEAFFPGRIDLGFGRGPGGSALPTQALAYPKAPCDVELYPELVQMLAGFIDGQQPHGHPFEALPVTPQGGSAPELWTLGSSSGSIDFAAHFGLGFVLALFIGTHERPSSIIENYRAQFRARHKSNMQQSAAIIASAVICADSKEEAELLAASHTYWKVMSFRHGVREGIRQPEQCMDLYQRLSLSDQAYFDETRNSMVTGTPVQCRDQLEQQARYYGVDEVMIVAVTHSFEKRAQSYQKLAAVFAD
ncbi:MAG: LLM class flavin-dependent oxidoreductase [Motiliproteus sp.]